MYLRQEPGESVLPFGIFEVVVEKFEPGRDRNGTPNARRLKDDADVV
jgi:hypothetical protein